MLTIGEMIYTTLYRIAVWCVIAFVAFFIPLYFIPNAHAATAYQASAQGSTGTGPTQLAACNAFVSNINAVGGWGVHGIVTGVTTVGIDFCTVSLEFGATGNVTVTQISVDCTGGKVENGAGECVCPSLTIEWVDSCVNPCTHAPARDVLHSYGEYKFGTSKPTSLLQTASTPLGTMRCSNGLRTFFKPQTGAVLQDGTIFYARRLENGVANYYIDGHFEYLCGGSAQPEACVSEPAPPDPLETLPADTCPAGQTVGTINGVTHCFTAAGDVENPNASEQAPTTVTTPTGGAGGSTTTTTYPDGSSSTVTKDAAGNVTGGTSTAGPGVGPGSEFCRQNPGNSACGSSVGGSCVAGFTCSGDAIQCAIMREQHIRNCKLFDDRTHPTTQLGDAMFDGTAVDENDPRSEGNRESVNLGSTFNVTPRIGHACVDDDVIEIYGAEIRLPWSELCPYLDIAGQVLVVLTLIMGMGILFGRTS